MSAGDGRASRMLPFQRSAWAGNKGTPKADVVRKSLRDLAGHPEPCQVGRQIMTLA